MSEYNIPVMVYEHSRKCY